MDGYGAAAEPLHGVGPYQDRSDRYAAAAHAYAPSSRGGNAAQAALALERARQAARDEEAARANLRVKYFRERKQAREHKLADIIHPPPSSQQGRQGPPSVRGGGGGGGYVPSSQRASRPPSGMAVGSERYGVGPVALARQQQAAAAAAAAAAQGQPGRRAPAPGRWR
jgi:hypothetical protein